MIETSRLAELQADLGSDALSRVVAVFVEEMDIAVAGLRAQPDSNALADGLHLIKGASANLGFSALAALADTGETLARKGQGPVDLGEFLFRIESLYASSREELMHELSSGASVLSRC